MRGRVHRQPQQDEVLSIHLLAKDTADVIVSGMAQGKQDMMEAFLSKPAGRGLSNVRFIPRLLIHDVSILF